MKVVIVSDSHGATEVLKTVKERHAEEIDAWIHCGDSALLSENPELKGFIYVRGNCDFDPAFVDEAIETIEGVPFYITHGHLYNVKMTRMNIVYRAQQVGAKVVCFGHSHIASSEMMNGVLLINPGSIMFPRMRKEKTYVILEMNEMTANVRFYDISGEEVTGLSRKYTFS